ncbi:MAG TPA: hypothetical protein VLF16_08440, partial [Pseudomonas sp.]|nr:hypothetical protein [Pseudomonas sp.]
MLGKGFRIVLASDGHFDRVEHHCQHGKWGWRKKYAWRPAQSTAHNKIVDNQPSSSEIDVIGNQ